ncbi:DUF4301 family protein [Seonamhaeicola aphaedonensis]|uniref:Uncharacterized protein DUF4301 n=1 Tax=Seonamhaeicola aphaedonensis TaxID=1461338 RepID=A0A3D9HMA8_9FLAO|nr:DUF4301 family protein [Seonamhaeicola aphaedonensis]RED50630.1 uncharacterized protein DUF4301 [Seonamhaeicola aphaedonensis]
MFSEKDIDQIHSKGITIDQLNLQVERLKNGVSYSKLLAAATIGRGIEKFTEKDTDSYIKFFESKKNNLSMVKFVPASGAATRMFKFLFQFLKKFNPKKETINQFIDRQSNDLVKTFFSNLEAFPFYKEVIRTLKKNKPAFNHMSYDETCKSFVKAMLDHKALNYSFFPKGLLPFHKYGDEVVSAFREHLLEATLYASSNNLANLHFTVSSNHLKYFEFEFESVNKGLTKETGVQFKVSYSYQKEATETVALTPDNSICRKEDGSILFRPAGHGALLENLNDLDYDLIFIKNIDNITVADKNVTISEYKKLLGGVLLHIQEKVFVYLNKLDKNDCDDEDYKIMALFLIHKLNVVIKPEFDNFSSDKKAAYLKEKLNRPIRVCGMVKNEGQPGGGPFWVKGKDSNISLQIVEFAQINFSSKEQQGIVYKATHFNPTDLVCAVKNYKGEKFNLKNYVDHNASFITTKTQNGVNIKALELPGLWNGSMAGWISVFVEVPLETFNPVKTVNDLLLPAHQVE